MTDRTNSARRESRYGPRVVRPSQVEVPRDGEGDVVDPEDEMDADLRDDTIVDTGDAKTQPDDDEEEDDNGQGQAEEEEEEEEEEDLPGPQRLNDDCIPVIRSQSNGYGGAVSNHKKVMMLVSDVSTLMAEIKEGVDEVSCVTSLCLDSSGQLTFFSFVIFTARARLGHVLPRNDRHLSRRSVPATNPRRSHSTSRTRSRCYRRRNVVQGCPCH